MFVRHVSKKKKKLLFSTIIQAFLAFDNFEKYWSCVCRMSLNFGLSNDSSLLNQGYGFWGRKIPEIKSHSHYFMSWVHVMGGYYLLIRPLIL